MAEGKARLQEALQRVAELEIAYQHTATDLDRRATDVTQVYPDLPIADQPHDVSNEAIYALRDAWQWTSKLHYCLEFQRSNAEQYSLFLYEANRAEQTLSQVFSWVSYQKDKECQDAAKLLANLRTICEQLLGCQATIDRLYRQAPSVPPVDLRTAQISNPVKVQALVDYITQDGAIKENQTYLLLENSNPSEWKVKISSDKLIKVPAIVISIPPPSSEAVMRSQKLRLQLLSTWKMAYNSLQELVRNSMGEYLSSRTPQDTEYLNPTQRSEVAKFLKQMSTLLHSEADDGSMLLTEFKADLENWQTKVDGITVTKPDLQGKGKTFHTEWKANQKTLKSLEDFAIYVGAYEEQVDSTRTAFQKVVNSKDAKFVSKAYINRINELEFEPSNTDEFMEHEDGHVIMEEWLPLVEEELTEVGESTRTVTTETAEEEYSCHTLKETKTYHIKAVVDPRTDERLSIYRAIAEGLISQTQGLYKNPNTGETMPIEEAMNKGYIIVEYVDKTIDQDKLIRQGIITTTSRAETVSYSVKNVKNPMTGEQISVAEAIEKGIIDQKRGRYMNPLTGDSITIADAIDKGFMEGKIFKREKLPSSSEIDHVDGMSPEWDMVDNIDREDYEGVDREYDNEMSEDSSQRDFIILGVRNPKTGKQMDLTDAINNGLIDLDNGVYYDHISGESMSLSDAAQRGLLRVKLADPSKDEFHPHMVKLKVLTNGNPNISLESAGDGELYDMYDEGGIIETENINQRVFDKLKGFMDTSIFGIKEEISGQEYTIEGAFENGVLKMDPLRLENSNGDKYNLQEAAALGLISPNALREVLKAVEENSLSHLVNSGQLDLETGVYFDPATNEAVPISQAIAEGRLDPDSIFYLDSASNTIYPLSSAIENNKFDSETGMIIDPKTGKAVPLADAVHEGIIGPVIDAERIAQQASSLKLLNANMDSSMKGIVDPVTGNKMSVEEAIIAGVLDIPRVEYVNPATGEAMTLVDAVDEKLVDPETAKQILTAISQCDLDHVIASGLIDPKTGKIIHPDTKRKMTVEEAIEAGVFDLYSVFVVDPGTNEIVSLGTLTEEGRFNPATGKFKDPLTNLEVGFSNAINKGIIKPKVHPEAFIADKASLQELLTTGRLTPQGAIFVTPNGREIDLKEALKEGYLNPTSVVKIDPKNGHIVLAEKPDEEMVKSMLELKEKLAVVAATEKNLAEQDLPVDNPDVLKQLATVQQDMKKRLERHASPVEDVLERSLAVLENNRNVSKDPTKQQQYQRLRFNTSDLKVRFGNVNTEVDQRHERIQNMSTNLDDYKESLDSFNTWAGEADGQLMGIKRSLADIDQAETVVPELQEFTQEALTRENQLKSLTRPASKFLTDVKEYEKDTEKFRHGLQTKYDRPVSHECHLAEDLKRAGQTLKDLVGDCTNLMEKVNDTVVKNRQYNDLRTKLNDWLPSMEERVNQCSAEVPPGDDPKVQVAELKSLTTDVIAEAQDVEDLKAVGKDLLAVLEELGCLDTPKAKEINEVLDTVQTKFDEIQENIVDKQHRLNQAVVQSQDVYRHLDGLLEWVKQVQDSLNNSPVISLDKNALNEQTQSHMILCSDIENHKAKLNSLEEKCQGKEGTELKLEDLHDKFAAVEEAAKDRAILLDNVSQKLGSFHSGVTQMDGWLTNAVNSLKRESTDYDQGTVKDKIENLYRQKVGKQKELNVLKKTGKELINNPQTGDKNKLRETLADVQGKWHDLTELLVQMISYAVS